MHIINIHQRRENETTLWQLSIDGYLEGVEHTPAECTRLRNIILDSKNGEPAELMPWKKFISLELYKYNVAYIDYNRAMRDKIRQDWTLDYGQEDDPVALEETRREFDAMFKRGHNHSGLDGDEEENEGSGDEGDGDQQAGVLDEDQRVPSQRPVIVGPSRGRGRGRGRGRR